MQNFSNYGMYKSTTGCFKCTVYNAQFVKVICSLCVELDWPHVNYTVVKTTIVMVGSGYSTAVLTT